MVRPSNYVFKKAYYEFIIIYVIDVITLVQKLFTLCNSAISPQKRRHNKVLKIPPTPLSLFLKKFSNISIEKESCFTKFYFYLEQKKPAPNYPIGRPNPRPTPRPSPRPSPRPGYPTGRPEYSSTMRQQIKR